MRLSDPLAGLGDGDPSGEREGGTSGMTNPDLASLNAQHTQTKAAAQCTKADCAAKHFATYC